jgi:hypothetical protein
MLAGLVGVLTLELLEALLKPLHLPLGLGQLPAHLAQLCLGGITLAVGPAELRSPSGQNVNT